MTCPRCQGLLIVNYDERYCANCAYRPAYAFVPRPVATKCYYCWRERVPGMAMCRDCRGKRIRYQREKRAQRKQEQS